MIGGRKTRVLSLFLILGFGPPVSERKQRIAQHKTGTDAEEQADEGRNAFHARLLPLRGSLPDAGRAARLPWAQTACAVRRAYGAVLRGAGCLPRACWAPKQGVGSHAGLPVLRATASAHEPGCRPLQRLRAQAATDHGRSSTAGVATLAAPQWQRPLLDLRVRDDEVDAWQRAVVDAAHVCPRRAHGAAWRRLSGRVPGPGSLLQCAAHGHEPPTLGRLLRVGSGANVPPPRAQTPTLLVRHARPVASGRRSPTSGAG